MHARPAPVIPITRHRYRDLQHMPRMNICLLGLDNLPVVSPEFAAHAVGGESVQQTLLARALVRLGHDVSMVTADRGQGDAVVRDGICIYRAYPPGGGVPVLRFIHPRWTGLWSALKRADAQLYYTSCAGMHVGLLALYCARHGRRFVFRCASDSDCDPARHLIRYARDRWLYAYGLRRADAILVQSAAQAAALRRHFGLGGEPAGMLVAPAPPAARRDIDVLWIGNIRRVKRPDRLLALAAQMPEAAIHMVGGPVPDEAALYGEIRRDAARYPNLTFRGAVPYGDANALYGRARLLANTSEVEGFPNAYLQSWALGVPAVTFNDPDGVIARHGLGAAVASVPEMRDSIRRLLGEPGALAAAGTRCRTYLQREYAEHKVLAPYLATFERLTSRTGSTPPLVAAGGGHRV